MTTPTRRPYTGSCHCGSTRYILYMTLPHLPIPVPEDRRPPTNVQLLYRCNCTVCQKSGFLHILPASPPDDFLLLAPTNLDAELGDYRASEGGRHWYFCRTCGMRCFAFMGPGEVVDVDVSDESLRKKLEEQKARSDGVVKAWRPKKEGWQGYLSVNGCTLDAGQEGLDFREWKDKGWLLYLDLLQLKGPGTMEMPQYGLPHEGGMY